MPENDNTPIVSITPPATPDAHGQAALILVESLIHGLIEQTVLTTSDSVAIVDRAIDVQTDIAEASNDAREMWRSQALLSSIASSLEHDLDDDERR
ncbi:hypothetical protein [Sphingomonas qomolangmaensis]|uniref:Uncharacterized protein n=1 Tax=Sphingomonas qomolangmaensis TaxID=2918765 RepID=A0ABY5LC08_9SPHN|nr:hypothetical protein [Sphingomonas qomolangmaensis]UUL83264.1 hypothetical protein NMP03_03260 [Sphingomonas qomolangmaensis]